MGLSVPRADSLDIIALQTIYFIGINPMGISDPWKDSIDIIALNPVLKIPRITIICRMVPWVNPLLIIALHTVKKC